MWVSDPLNLRAFTQDSVDAAFEGFWKGFDFLVGRRVERISQGGIPMSAYAGRPRILAMLEDAAKRTSIPSTADFEESIDAIRHLGIKKLVVASKWDAELMERVRQYLADAGITPVGLYGQERSTRQLPVLQPQESVDVALELGREAFKKSPDADGLLLGGGAWLTLQAIPMLEAEFGRPVVTNPSATYWAALRQAKLKPNPGYGILLDSLS
jgi:arylmalonate decarboxylase